MKGKVTYNGKTTRMISDFSFTILDSTKFHHFLEYIYSRMYVYTHIQTHIHMNMCVCIYIYTHTHAYIF